MFRKMNINAIIFDLDGVICHTDKFHYLAWKKICDENNLIFNKNINEKLKGVSRIECYNIILKENNKFDNEDNKVSITNKKNEFYKEYLLNMDKSYLSEDVNYTLKKLKEKKILMAIGSSSKNAKLILEKLGLQNFFDAVSDGNDIKFSKPNPEVFIKACQKLNMEALECAVVEDAFSGVQAALNAKMTVFAYNQEHTTFNNGNVIKINNISDILNYIN